MFGDMLQKVKIIMEEAGVHVIILMGTKMRKARMGRELRACFDPELTPLSVNAWT